MPQLEEVVDLMHAHGKLTTCHVDGDMKRLLKDFSQTGVDIAEALAPEPLCNYTLAEARQAFVDRKTIWGGFPTVLFLDTFTEQYFDTYVNKVFDTIAPGKRFILSMGDNVPPNGIIDRVNRITKLIEQLGDLPIYLEHS